MDKEKEIMEALNGGHLKDGQLMLREIYMPEMAAVKLFPEMKQPKKPVKVMLVENFTNNARGLEEILKIWPDVRTYIFIQAGGKSPVKDVNCTFDIILLDDHLENITGSDIVQELRDKGFTGVVASITDNECPAWARLDYHFGNKPGVLTNIQAAEKFVRWMNFLIDEVEAIRLD